ncbi:replication initiator protein A [Bacteriovoracaceae bacterium]|nr:replication initiator protein A [Bacteriovoracaceae bacterium]
MELELPITHDVVSPDFQPEDGSWDLRKNNDLITNARYSISFPYPLNQPKKDALGFHETEYKIETEEITCEYTAKKEYGIPFGSDSLITTWIRNRAIKMKSPSVTFKTAGEILSDLNKPKNAQNYRWLKDSLLRILNSRASFKSKSEKENINSFFSNWVKGYNIWCSDDYNSGQGNIIELEEAYFQMLMKENTTIEEDLQVLVSLSDNPGAMQLYRILNLESKMLKDGQASTKSIPLEVLKKRIGVSATKTNSRFKNQLKTWLEKVNTKFKDIYKEEKRSLPFWIEGNELIVCSANLLPLQIDSMKIETFTPSIDGYLNLFKSTHLKSDETSYIRALNKMNIPLDKIGSCISEVQNHGDLRFRSIKKIARYLAKENNYEKILKRVENRILQ